jgi:hypothetical protein
VSPRFFADVSAYLDAERPAGTATGKVFVVLKARAAASRYRQTGWMRSSMVRAPGPSFRARPVISCAIPA